MLSMRIFSTSAVLGNIMLWPSGPDVSDKHCDHLEISSACVLLEMAHQNHAVPPHKLMDATTSWSGPHTIMTGGLYLAFAPRAAGKHFSTCIVVSSRIQGSAS